MNKNDMWEPDSRYAGGEGFIAWASLATLRVAKEYPVQLQLKTWQFVDDYLKTKTGIIIPIGSTEQHGPTGLIGTDALTAEMIGRGAGEKVGALV
ncbi:MAG: creatininase family protein, partial [Reyranella sp.]|nr:creatininase family protein [Reyranella sp.]